MRLSTAFALSAVFFVVGLAAGLVAPAEGLIELLRGVLGSEPPRWFTLETMLRIFLHNVTVALLIYGLSIVYVGVVLVAFNGYIVGSVAVASLHGGYPVGKILAALAPHGVVEVPALLLASALGLQASASLRGGSGATIRSTLRRMWVVVAMLAVAAAIETYVTPALVGAH